EYRGYDSAGIALVSDGAIAWSKRAGKLANLEKARADDPLPPSTTGIGHTRWATHGAPNDVNAHPHLGNHGRVALVHNGIIENFARLRAEVEAAGDDLRSETDTEIAAHLLETALERGGDLTDAMRAVCQRLEGRVPLLPEDGGGGRQGGGGAVAGGGGGGEPPPRLAPARRNSPLVVGIGEGENFIGS